ncbi:MAG: hypothetical protein OHK93_001186 [Ramalina farinacea]|uniref:Uncharacterized protein n=1 Tax=Ramalina farinacea TaxID=258253 RepID=A0AA43QP12_9LECA|nr:hypothetical protein [Ramalina farinacea]
MPPSQTSEKDGVQAGDLGSLLSSSLKISEKPVKGLCDLPVEVLEKICRYLLGDQLLEFDSPTFETKRPRPRFTCCRMPLPQDIDAASERYEAVRLDTGAGAKISQWDATSSSNQDIAVANSWAGTEMIPPHMQIPFTKDMCVTKLDLGAMATCWKLRVPAVPKRGQLLNVAYGDNVDWRPSVFPFEAPKFPFPLEIADMETDLPATEYSDNEDSD